MESALKEVREGRMSRNAASKAFSVPRSTLCDKLDGKTPEDRRMGPPSVLGHSMTDHPVNSTAPSQSEMKFGMYALYDWESYHTNYHLLS